MAGWSGAELDALRRYVAEGLSATEIAYRLGGRSRNAVIGKVHRLKLKLAGNAGARSSEPTTNTDPGRSIPRRPGRAGVRPPHDATPARRSFSASRAVGAPAGRANVPDGQSALRAAPEAALPAPEPMSFLEAVDRGRCLFFAGDRLGPSGPDMPVCGAERAFDAPPRNRYCAHHVALSVGTGTRGEQDAERALSRMGRTK